MMKTFGIAVVLSISSLMLATSARAEEEVGPHKGAVVEWGDEEYHLEVVPDAKAGTVTVYVYGDHKDLHKAKAKAIDAKMLVLALKTNPAVTVKLDPKPIKNDGEGKSSIFVGKNDVFTKDMKFEGTISGKVGTKPYSGTFKQK